MTFHNLRTENLTRAEIEELKSRLISEFSSIIEDFGILVDRTLAVLENQHVTIEDLKSLIRRAQHHRPILELFAEIDDVRSLFDNLDDYWSFFDYELLTMFIRRFGNSELKYEMEVYLTKFKNFCRRRLTEVPRDVKTKSSEKNIQLFVKLDENFSDIALSEVKSLQSELQKMIKTELFLQTVDNGCVLLVFATLIDRNKQFSFSYEQKHDLFQLRILEIFGSNHVVHYHRSNYPFTSYRPNESGKAVRS